MNDSIHKNFYYWLAPEIGSLIIMPLALELQFHMQTRD